MYKPKIEVQSEEWEFLVKFKATTHATDEFRYFIDVEGKIVLFDHEKSTDSITWQTSSHSVAEEGYEKTTVGTIHGVLIKRISMENEGKSMPYEMDDHDEDMYLNNF